MSTENAVEVVPSVSSPNAIAAAAIKAARAKAGAENLARGPDQEKLTADDPDASPEGRAPPGVPPVVPPVEPALPPEDGYLDTLIRRDQLHSL